MTDDRYINISTHPPDKRTSLEDLISRCATNDYSAFNEVYQLVSPKLEQIARRILGNYELVDDVLQESWLRVWQYASRYDRSKGAPISWLSSIVRNQALTFLVNRQNVSIKFDTCSFEDIPAVGNCPVHVTETITKLEQLADHLQSIQKQHQHSVVQILYHGWTPTELATRERRPVNTVKTWYRRGLQSLRARYEL